MNSDACSYWPTNCVAHRHRWSPAVDEGDGFVLCYASGSNAVFYQAICTGMQTMVTPKTMLAISATGTNTRSGSSSASFDRAVLIAGKSSLALDLCDVTPFDSSARDGHIYPGSIFTCRSDTTLLTASFHLPNPGFQISLGRLGTRQVPNVWDAQTEATNSARYDVNGPLSQDGRGVDTSIQLQLGSSGGYGCAWVLLGTFVDEGSSSDSSDGIDSENDLRGGGPSDDWSGQQCSVTVDPALSPAGQQWSVNSSVLLQWDGKNFTNFDLSNGRVASATTTIAASTTVLPTATESPAALQPDNSQTPSSSSSSGPIVGACAAAVVLIAMAMVIRYKRGNLAKVAVDKPVDPLPSSASQVYPPSPTTDLSYATRSSVMNRPYSLATSTADGPDGAMQSYSVLDPRAYNLSPTLVRSFSAEQPAPAATMQLLPTEQPVYFAQTESPMAYSVPVSSLPPLPVTPPSPVYDPYAVHPNVSAMHRLSQHTTDEVLILRSEPSPHSEDAVLMFSPGEDTQPTPH
ncbi:hypothetical protein RI367_007520 [Sorochytrium milnesiophthora]